MTEPEVDPALPVSVRQRGRGHLNHERREERPAASRTTVTLDGSAGSSRDQRTSTSPILGSRKWPLPVTLNRALAVNRIACRESFRDRNRGGATLGPFR